MSKEWPYAKLAQEAANAGGPEKFLEVIKKAAYEAGMSDAKHALIVPLTVAGIGLVGVGVAVTIGGQKIHKKIVDRKQKRLIAAQEAAEAEAYIKEAISKPTDEKISNDRVQAE